MNAPTEILADEHKNIIIVIDALDRECDALVSGKELDKNFIEKAIDFFRNYADKFHHAKEEEILFKELRRNSDKIDCEPTVQMEYEHELGRNFIKQMEEGLNENNKRKLVENARRYIQLLQEHIFKEDNILFPMADSALDNKAQKLMSLKFKQIEQERFGDKIKSKYLLFAKELEKSR